MKKPFLERGRGRGRCEVLGGSTKAGLQTVKGAKRGTVRREIQDKILDEGGGIKNNHKHRIENTWMGGT